MRRLASGLERLLNISFSAFRVGCYNVNSGEPARFIKLTAKIEIVIANGLLSFIHC